MGIVRRRTRRRALVVAGGAAGAAYVAGKHRGRNEQSQYAGQGYPDQGNAPQEPQDVAPVPPAPPPPAPTSGGSDLDEIQQLADLHAAGTLTDDEFAAAKAKVLGI